MIYDAHLETAFDHGPVAIGSAHLNLSRTFTDSAEFEAAFGIDRSLHYLFIA